MASLQKAIAQLMEGRQDRLAQRSDPPQLAALLAQVRERVAPADREHAEAFARELFAKAHRLLGADDAGERLAGMTASAYAFLRAHGSAPISVRVIAPQDERDGWSSSLTVVESIVADRPFIVDTLRDTLTAQGGEIHVLLHPILGVERAADGTLIRLGGPDAAPTRESFFHAEVASLAPSAALEQQLTEDLRQVLAATADYVAMRERIAAVAAALRAHPPPPPWDDDRDELAAFLDWLGHKSFVYLGYREYDVLGAPGSRAAAVRPGCGLGLLRDDARSTYRTATRLPGELERRLDRPPLWLMSKTRAVSPIHRRAPMDDIVVKEVDAEGRVIGIRRLLGLFTAKAYADAASELPILRRRLDAILAQEGAVADSHDHRDLVALFNSLPHEELLASEPHDIHQAIRSIRVADGLAGIQVFCRPDAWRRGLFVVVLVARARFSTALHARVAATLREELRATVLQDHLALDDRPVARLHVYCAVPPDVLAQPPVEALQRQLTALLRTWDDELREVLAERAPRLEAERLASRYARALPAAYKAGTAIADAVRDVRCLEVLAATGTAQIEVVAARDGSRQCALKLYLSGESLALSEFVPVLENLGMRVLGQDVVDVALPSAEATAIHTFAVEPAEGGGDLAASAPRVIAALHALRAGAVESDRLNSLIVTAGLDWRGADLLRAYVDHAHQVGRAARPLLIESLTANPTSAGHLYRCFAAAFDPTTSPLSAADRAAGPIADARAQFVAALEAVQSLAHDRVLRALGVTVAATVRTNFYSGDTAPLALKFDAARLPHLPPPRPAIETWVHGARMAGVHLRAGRVARGGIRASDRPDDFRSEILGLLRTQMVKNAVIVPVGAKGGFVIKGQPRGLPADPARSAGAYRDFIDGLLSITDNVENGQVVAPRGQLVHDGPDPYLVVAADKGTARFSDIANGLAAARGFWLGDAFASGGEHGYDHKRLGITARGAWECARQHFRELQRDLDREVITVAGIGDMSGDVFGNGLLRSRHLRLLGAFNHREIFLDPDPDPDVAYRERERLAQLPYSSWSDYAPLCLSRGGGVYPRSAKAIPLAAEARTLLGLDVLAPSGEDIVRAILRLPVDLLWNGGIGTYIKASDERDVDVADPANDAVRINASALRATVVAEGGNLGLTQRARIEYALAGGRINTDAIDNSGGVDLSDHEVNLKIALQPLCAGGELPAEARHAVLAELADPVCAAVLAHNRRQAAALTLDQWRSRAQLAAFRDLISILEVDAGLDRSLANLPTRETLRARRGLYLGLTRPELAVLMAHTKLDLQRRIVQSPLCEEPTLESYLRGYFPPAFVERFAAAVMRHPLRREIVALELANALIDTMGMTFLVRAVRDTGRDVLEIVRAWSAACAVLGAAAARDALDAARARLSADADQRIALDVANALERAALWLVQTQPAGLSLAALIERFQHPIATLFTMWPDDLTPPGRDSHAAAVSGLMDAGLTPVLAERLVCLGDAEAAFEIVHIAHMGGVPLPFGAAAYWQTASLVDLAWVRRVLPSSLPAEDRWEPRAVASLLEVLRDMRRQITLQVLSHRRGSTPIDDCLQAYAATRLEQLEMVNELITDLKAAAQPTLPALLVLIREVGRLARPPQPDSAW